MTDSFSRFQCRQQANLSNQALYQQVQKVLKLSQFQKSSQKQLANVISRTQKLENVKTSHYSLLEQVYQQLILLRSLKKSKLQEERQQNLDQLRNDIINYKEQEEQLKQSVQLEHQKMRKQNHSLIRTETLENHSLITEMRELDKQMIQQNHDFIFQQDQEHRLRMEQIRSQKAQLQQERQKLDKSQFLMNHVKSEKSIRRLQLAGHEMTQKINYLQSLNHKSNEQLTDLYRMPFRDYVQKYQLILNNQSNSQLQWSMYWNQGQPTKLPPIIPLSPYGNEKQPRQVKGVNHDAQTGLIFVFQSEQVQYQKFKYINISTNSPQRSRKIMSLSQIIENFKFQRRSLIQQEIDGLELLLNNWLNRSKFPLKQSDLEEEQQVSSTNETVKQDNQKKKAESLINFLHLAKSLFEQEETLNTISSLRQTLDYMKQILVNEIKLQEEQFTILDQDLDKKRGHKFTRRANLILKQWLYKNYSYPYPAQEQTQMLAEKCDLTYKQIQIWFINARGRIQTKTYNQKKFKNIVKQKYLTLSQKRKLVL